MLRPCSSRETVVARPRRRDVPPGPRLRVLGRIGEGGMAEIFLGESRHPDDFPHRVAIKKVHPRFVDDPRIVEMLIREARIAASLSHPNIVQILDLGVNERREHYIVMEHVEGHDLGRVLRASPRRLPLDCALYVMAEVCAALEHVHRKADSSGRAMRLIHRDVSPSNILISVDGLVKLADFGLARYGALQSFEGYVEGKIPYMSPEQARGLPLDRRSDLYSVGVVLFELLVGQALFDAGGDAELLRRVQAAETERAVSEAGLPAGLERLLGGCLARDPEARFQSAAEVELALREQLRSCQHLVGARRLASVVSERCRPAPRRAFAARGRVPVRPALVAPVRRWLSQRTRYSNPEASVYHDDDTTERASRPAFLRQRGVVSCE